MSFWNDLPKPILVLAPMADVTDRAFRFIIAKYSKWGGLDIGDGSKENLPAEAFRVGGPDVFWTEFVSADGLFMGGHDALINDLAFTEAERPIVAQFFTSKPDMMRKASELARELGFDGIDINMGCPDKSVEKQGAGAGLIKNPALAVEIIAAAKEGAGDLPVSVKTRIGYNKNEIETWIPALLEAKPAVLTLHARTRKEMSDVPARWEHVKRAVEIRNEMKSETLIFGNGDVLGVEDAKEKAALSGADGVMLGRAIFGNPFLFSSLHSELKGSSLGISSSRSNLDLKLRVLIEHTHLFEKLVGQESTSDKGLDGGSASALRSGELRRTKQGKNFAVMKKHFKAYVNGFDGAKELRMKLMEAENAGQVESIINSFLANSQNLA